MLSVGSFPQCDNLVTFSLWAKVAFRFISVVVVTQRYTLLQHL